MPDPGHQETQERYWKEEGDRFDDIYHEGRSRDSPARHFLEKRTLILREMLHEFPQDSSVILDLGCGSGVHAAYIKRGQTRVIGLDFSRVMLQQARARSEQGDAFGQADATRIPLSERSCAACVSMGLLDYLAEPSVVLLEVGRVLKAGAPFVFSIPKNPSLFGFLRWGPGLWLRRALFNLPPILTAVSRSQLETLVQDSGFTLQRVESVWTTMWMVQTKRAE